MYIQKVIKIKIYIYMVYGFYLKNIMDYYERIYKRIQDVISNIGGITVK